MWTIIYLYLYINLSPYKLVSAIAKMGDGGEGVQR
jgi:hypothetical protein